MRSIATLVVDDNDAYRAGLIEYLHTQAGVDIVGEAEDGSEAILLTQELDPDLVLMDISMPGIGGLEATRVIKEQHAKVKVVLVTIHEEKTYRRLTGLVHADGFICKSDIKRDVPKVLGKIRADLERR